MSARPLFIPNLSASAARRELDYLLLCVVTGRSLGAKVRAENPAGIPTGLRAVREPPDASLRGSPDSGVEQPAEKCLTAGNHPGAQGATPPESEGSLLALHARVVADG